MCFCTKSFFSISILSIPIMLIGINGGYFSAICRVCLLELAHYIILWRSAITFENDSEGRPPRNQDTIYIQTLKMYKIVQNRLRYVENNTKFILWQDIINNTVTSPKSDNRTPLNGDQLKVEIERLQRKVDIVGIVYCVREGAPDVYNKLKETEIPVLHIVKNLLSR